MTLLHTLTHANVCVNGRVVERQAVRAVVMRGTDILLLYTRRYDDFSLPGGGLDAGEDHLTGLRRELLEETGAFDVEVDAYLGHVDEHRPSLKPDYDVLFMRSHIYACRIEGELGAARPEAYEVANGMVARWMDIGAAIAHNRRVMRERPATMGMSVARETWLLDHLAHHRQGKMAPTVK